MERAHPERHPASRPGGPNASDLPRRVVRGLAAASLAAGLCLCGALSLAEQGPTGPRPPTSIAPRPGVSSPAKLQEIRERARKRAAERRAGAGADEELGGEETIEPAAPIGGEKLTPDSVEEGLGADYIPPGRGQKVNLNLVDVELADLVRAIAVATGKRFIITGKVRSVKATLFSPTPVGAGEAYQAFLSVLAANGMTVVPSGRYLKLVESGEAVTSPVPLCTDGEACETGDRIITRLHRLRHVSADDMSQVLSRFKTSDGDITAYAPTNTLIITDYARNVRRMLRIVQELDVEGVGTNIWIEPVYYSSAEEIAGLLTQLFPPEQGSTKTTAARTTPTVPRRGKQPTPAKEGAATTVGSTRSGERLRMIIPDQRTNQLIIVASERTYLQILELIRALDTPLGEADGEIRVHKLQHADAEQLASTLSALSGKASTTKAPARGGAAAKTSAPSAASLFEGNVQVTADKATNALIIVGSARDYMSLRQVIDELDVERRQVFVEAVIMEVSLEAQRRLGLAFHGSGAGETDLGDRASGDTIGLGATAFTGDGGTLSSLLLDPSMLQGLALGIRGPEIEGSEDSNILPAGVSIPAFGVVLQALQVSSDVNVLSTPHILAMDNEEAEIQVGQNVPVSTSFASGAGALSGLLSRATGGQAAASALGGASSLFPQMSIGRQNVGIKLAVTPHINQFEQVRLEIEVEVSEVTSESELGPIIGQRVAKTTCMMADQQTVVLGGLVTDNVTYQVSKVPVLGDIPVLGRLFQRTAKRTTKRNLLIFLTPYIVRDSTDFRRIFARKMQERRDFIDRYTAFEYHEVQPDIDYDRTNGMLEEINRTIEDLDERERQRQLLDSLEEPEHRPRPPVGVVPPGALDGDGGGEGEGEGEGGGGPTIVPPLMRRQFGGGPPPPTAVAAPGGDEGGEEEGEE